MTASNDTRCNEKLQLVKRYRIVDIPMKYDPGAVFCIYVNLYYYLPNTGLKNLVQKYINAPMQIWKMLQVTKAT